jgi:hypothetical protein
VQKTKTAPAERTAVKTGGANYEPGVLDRQPRIVDLIPRAAWAHALLLVLVLGVAGGLVAVHRWSAAGSVRASIFDPQAAGSLASWFSSTLLAVGVAVSMICYSLRRQRQSDYHGRYRIWLWTAGVVMLMSVAATSPWHMLLGKVVAQATGIAASGGGVLWWLGLSALVMSYVAVRLLFEMRGCRVSTASLIGAALAYTVVGAARLELDLAVEPATIALMAACGWLFGHVLFVFSLLWYARHTVLDIQGLIQPKGTENNSSELKQQQVAAESKAAVGDSSKTPTPATTAKASVNRRLDAAHATPPAPKRRSDVDTDMPPTKRAARLLEGADYEEDRFEADEQEERITQRRQRKPKRPVQPRDEEVEDEQLDFRKLSKSERKRLRKLKAEQRRAA